MIDNDFRYLRNAATFKDIRAGENGLELFKVEKAFYFLKLLSNWDVELLLELVSCVAGGNERSREQVRLDFQGRGHLHSDHQEPHC